MEKMSKQPSAKEAAGDDREARGIVAAQAELWEHISGFFSCGALRWMLRMRLPSMIHAHGGRVGLEQLAAELAIQSSPTKVDCLRRILRYSAHKKLLCMLEEEEKEGEEERKYSYCYGLTPSSELLVQGQEKSLEAFARLILRPDAVAFMYEDLWAILEGRPSSNSSSRGLPQKQEDCSNGDLEKWAFTERDGEMNASFMEAMVSHTSMVVGVIVRGLGKWGGLDGVRTLVDVGGNEGQVSGAIANAFPHVKCSVLELGHVVDAIAQPHPLVTIVKGDMFQAIPKSDVVFMKSILHGYDDEDCIKILRKCKEAIPAGSGKVILAEIFLDDKVDDGLYGARLCMDVTLIRVGGRERTAEEWSRVITGAGFSHYHVTAMEAMESLFYLYP